MVRPDPDGDPRVRLVLHLWRSRVDLRDSNADTAPLWIGMAATERISRVLGLVTLAREEPNVDRPRDALAKIFPSGRLAHRNSVPTGTAWDGSVLLAHDPALTPKSD